MPDRCGSCDVCDTEVAKRDFMAEFKTLLSCIQEISAKCPYGIGMYINVLSGSNQKKVTDKGFEKLKCFGQVIGYRDLCGSGLGLG